MTLRFDWACTHGRELEKKHDAYRLLRCKCSETILLSLCHISTDCLRLQTLAFSSHRLPFKRSGWFSSYRQALYALLCSLHQKWSFVEKYALYRAGTYYEELGDFEAQTVTGCSISWSYQKSCTNSVRLLDLTSSVLIRPSTCNGVLARYCSKGRRSSVYSILSL